MEITKENYDKLKEQKLTRAKIAEQFNIPEWKLKKLIASNGWGITRPKVRNDTAFIEESEAAYYWAGFIAADGNISDKDDLYICLHSKDTEHLHKFLSYLKSNHAVSTNNDKYTRSQIGLRLPPPIASSLKNKFNIVPRKSLTYKLPDIVESDNFRHYVRGYFDGDGSVGEYFNNDESILSSLSCNITGSNDFIQSLYTVLKNKLDVLGCVCKRKDSDVSVISFKLKDTRKLLNYMYDSSTVSLSRKFVIYHKICVENRRKFRKGNNIVNDR